MSKNNTHSGMAALSICESLLLALNDAQLLPESEILGVLEDAAVTHENAINNADETDTDLDNHKAVAALIRRIIASGNSVRRP